MSNKSSKKIGLLGGAFDTGNLGVSALTESSIKILLNRWTEAKIILLGGMELLEEEKLSIGDKVVSIQKIPIRISKNIFLKNHFLRLLVSAFLLKIFGSNRRFLVNHNKYLKEIIEMDFVVDLSGGDSFSDIYGMKRLVFVFIFKWLMLFLGKPLVLMPQTYGPFRTFIGKHAARYIFKKSKTIFSRDMQSTEYLHKVLDNSSFIKKVKTVPDVAFVLDSRKPDNIAEKAVFQSSRSESVLVGLNISGLMWNGGYLNRLGASKENMFGLSADYCSLIPDICRKLLADNDTNLLFIPHVIVESGYSESDIDASQKVYEQLEQEYSGRIFLIADKYSHNEIKYVIGKCDFFIGSRMHSCIAAMSQYVPTIGIAYSRKFHGVFESINQGDCVADACELCNESIITKIESAYTNRMQIKESLREVIPQRQVTLLNLFEDFQNYVAANSG